MKAILLGAALVLASLISSCNSAPDIASAVSVPTPSGDETVSPWTNVPRKYLSNERLKRAWEDFEHSQKYRLAQATDRNLTPAAAARVRSNNPNQIIPILNWWGARGYTSANPGDDYLVAIMVDPMRTDAKRYALVVITAVASEGADYKTYWVLKDEDMESFLISPASGGLFIECFYRDGTEQTKQLTWDKKEREFRLT